MTPNCKINRIHSADVLVDVADNTPLYAFVFRENSKNKHFSFRTYRITEFSIGRLTKCFPQHEVSVGGKTITLSFTK